MVRAEQFEESIELFLKSANWQMFINVCLKLKYSSGVYLDKLNSMIEKLKIENKHLECAQIYENYLNDPENAVLSLITGSHWFEAVTLIQKVDRFDFLETNLLPSLKSNQQDLLRSIEQFEKKFLENKERLDQVREEKAKKEKEN